jgi:hypothetical protein
MNDDPIVSEVRRVRDEHAAKFNYDLDAIYQDLKEHERKSGRKYVRYEPRPYVAPERQIAAVTACQGK